MLMKSPQTWLICPQAPFYVNRIDWYCVGLTETTMSTSRVICMPQQRCKNAENTYLPALRGGPNLAIPLSFLLVTIECICKIWWLLLPGRIAEYRGERACLCLPVRYSISNYNVSTPPNVLYMLPIAVARFSSGSDVIQYVLPVLWMTSCLRLPYVMRTLYVIARKKSKQNYWFAL